MHSSPTKNRAVQYVRMSTERQEYSIEFQTATNVAYAAERGLEIVRTYIDAGISGVRIENRSGLRKLIADALSEQADFGTILVYDVSRWGRFINTDQSAHYEFICTEAGIKVAYCAEPFENDGSPTSTLMKHLKRAMAAEYSRDLSAKVTRAQKGLLREGFFVGGCIPFGYRPAHVRRSGELLPLPESRDWRKQQGVRTKLVLGPPEEVELVRRIFRMYARPTGTIANISRRLTAEPGTVAAFGKWTPRRTGYTLQNETYVGRLISGRRLKAVGEKWGSPLPRQDWTICEGGAPSIITPAAFEAAQRKRLRRGSLVRDEEVLADIRRIAKAHGDINQRLLQGHGRWSWNVYYRVFGSIDAIRDLVGLPVPEKFKSRRTNLLRGRCFEGEPRRTYSDDDLRDHLRKVLQLHGYLSGQLLETVGPPNGSTIIRRFGNLSRTYKEVGFEPSELQTRAARAAVKAIATRRKSSEIRPSGV